MPAERNIPLAKPWFDDREIEAAARAIRSGWVTQGAEVAHFEEEFAAYVRAPYACAVSSCTAALQLVLAALDLGPGDEVVLPSHTFVAAAAAVIHQGATPVFAEIDPATFNVRADSVERSLSPRTKAIIAVHQLGMPCDLAGIAAIAAARKLAVIEDAACAAGSELAWAGAWEKIGAPHGDIACFSFHPRKIITTGEGGMLTTRDPAMDAAFRLLRQHGMSISDKDRHESRKIVFEQYVRPGFNFRMTDIQAAIGREQLRKLPLVIEKRRALATRQHRLLARRPDLTPPLEPAWAKSNYQSYCVGLPESADQQRVMQVLLDQGISTKKGVLCTHLEPGFRDRGLVRDPRGLAASEYAEKHSILLPLFHELTEEDQDRATNALLAAIGRR